MIPRRVHERLKSQRWMAVGVDFVIVVAGVFVGIQAANWNEARLDRAAERRALELLLEEAQNNVAYSRLILHRADGLQRDRLAAAAMLEARVAADGDAVRGLANMSVFRDMTPIHAAHDELTSSGDITLIRSPTIRNALALYNGVVIFHDRARRELIERAPDIMGLASAYMTVKYDPSGPLGYTASVDWAAAAGDLELVNAVNRVMGQQLAFNERRRIILEHAEALCGSLAAELSRACLPPDWISAEIRGARSR